MGWNIGVNIECNSDCHSWCPRVLRIFCCCCRADSETEEKTAEVAAETFKNPVIEAKKSIKFESVQDFPEINDVD